MTVPNLPGAACQVLRGVVASLASAGLITNTDAQAIIEALGLRNAFFNTDASLEIDRLTIENERLRENHGRVA